MNTHNVNVNTATPESPKTWGKGQGIPGLNPALAASLNLLSTLHTERMTLDERLELLYGSLSTLAERMADTVTDWSLPRPVLPLASWQAWDAAKAMAHGLPGIDGDAAWESAMGDLRLMLKAGYAMHVADVY
ncbi:hypothetical protein IAE30_27670 [Pantoea sp. S61]|uniref:hypothetical protein n=1 Tax=Pantoea sp. S61 TaxID=2767442 RepID=UPI00190A27EC|nr:hypothetical protein [Pantoea sp. S61]MBK0127523.1 hypothetical protein [Pantoea sp. S61]